MERGVNALAFDHTASRIACNSAGGSRGLRPKTDLHEVLGIDIGSDGFVDVPQPKVAPCRSSREGVFVAGTASGPKDIVDTIVEAGAAAAEAALYLKQAAVGVA